MEKFKICEKCQEKDRVTNKLYASLCSNLDAMKDRILGDDYYNLGLDVYQTHRFLCRDIVHKYERMKESRDSWRIFGIAMATGWIVFVILIGLCGGK